MNKIIIVENNIEREVTTIPNLMVEWLGENALLKIHIPFSFKNSKIQINSDCFIEILEFSNIRNLFIRCASVNSTIRIGKKFNIESGQFILPNGYKLQSLEIGDNCLFSSDIFIQSADGHTILDMNGNILNDTTGNIKIGNHVWLGHKVSVLKKAQIANNTIVAESAVVTKPFLRENCILAGIPAKIIKINTNWSIKSIENYRKENKKNA